MITVFITGLLFGLSLIVAIGAQNVFVLRQGALRRHVGSVVAICAVSDVVLIIAGVAGAGAVLTGHRHLLAAVRVAGAAALVTYGALAARRALRPGPVRSGGEVPRTTRAGVAAAALAFTWLNPAVYLDTVVLLGSVAAASRSEWTFAAGAAVASTLWFAGLGFGARLAAPRLRSARTWRGIDAFVAAIMAVTAVRVLAGA